MDLGDLSLTSDEDLKNTQDNSNEMKVSESDNESNNFPICTDKNFNQNGDQSLQKFDETDDDAVKTEVSKKKTQNETQVLLDWSAGAIAECSPVDISFNSISCSSSSIVSNNKPLDENLKTAHDMEISEADNEFLFGIDKNSDQNNDLQKYNEVGREAVLVKTSKTNARNKTRALLDWSTKAIAKSSPTDISFSSTDAICSSSSSNEPLEKVLKMAKVTSHEMEISESENEGKQFPSSIDENSNQNNDLQKYDEFEDDAAVTKTSKTMVQNKTRALLDWSTGAIPKCSAMDISFNSTGAIFGSASSSRTSSVESLNDLEEISNRYVPEDISNNLVHPNLETAMETVESFSKSTSTTSFTDIKSTDESKTAVGVSSSLPEDFGPLKSKKMCTGLGSFNLLSSPIENSPGKTETDEYSLKMHISNTSTCGKSSDNEMMSFNAKTTSVIPFPVGTSFKSNGDDETVDTRSECSATGGSHNSDKDYCQIASFNRTREDEIIGTFLDCGATSASYSSNKSNGQREDKSVRRKIRSVDMKLPETNFPPTRSGVCLVTDVIEGVSRSMLNLSESAEYKNVDRDFHETYGKKGDVQNFTSMPWKKDIFSYGCKTKNEDTSPRLDTESLLKEVQHFFRHNRVEPDETLSFRKRKYRIVTSKYFSDEFARSHGLLTLDELFQKNMMDLELSCLRNDLKLEKLCKTLIRCGIPERTFVSFCEDCILPESGSSAQSSRGSFLHEALRSQFFLRLQEDVGSDVVQRLYKKVAFEGQSFLNILIEMEKCGTNVRSYDIESPSTSQTTTHVFEDTTATASSSCATYVPLNRDLLRKKPKAIVSLSNNERNRLQNDESETESSQADSRESKESLNVISKSDSKDVDSSLIEISNQSKTELSRAYLGESKDAINVISESGSKVLDCSAIEINESDSSQACSGKSKESSCVISKSFSKIVDSSLMQISNEPKTESSQAYSGESKETLNVISESDSKVKSSSPMEMN